MLIPRVTTAQRNLISNPATGLLVFDNTTSSFWFYDGGWIELVSRNTSLRDNDNDTKVQVEENPGATGGADSYSLSTSQLPAHNHTGSGTTSTAGNHRHSQSGYNLIGGSGPIPWYNWANSFFSTNDPRTGYAGDHSHTFSFTTSSTESGAAIDNRLMYYTLTYIMKL